MLLYSRIPRYDELVASDSEALPSDSEAPPSNSEAPPSDSEDEEALEEQEVFERRYNFRFEEPDADLVNFPLSPLPVLRACFLGGG